MKAIMKKITFLMIIMLMIVGFLPSSSYAAPKVLTYTYRNGKYICDVPGFVHSCKGTSRIANETLHFSFDFDEIVVKYDNVNSLGNKFWFSFEDGKHNTVEEQRCEVCKNYNANAGILAAKYLVNHKVEEKKIIFTKLAEITIDSAQRFAVTPATVEDAGSLQPGAVIHPDFASMGYTPPTYKIKSLARLRFVDRWIRSDYYKLWIETEIGNASISNNNLTSQNVTHPSVYVFARSSLPENKLYMFADVQNGKSIEVKYEGENENWKINGPSSMQMGSTSRAGTFQFSNTTVSEIAYQYIGLTAESLSQEDANGFEKIITTIGCAVYDLVRYALSSQFGDMLSIDSLVFNIFDKTKLDFWRTEGGGTYTEFFITIINGWFRIFRGFAYAILVVILVAMAIKTMLMAGTSKANKINEMLVGWVVAVFILSFGPFFMKYAVVLNDSVVKIFRDSSEYSIYSVYNTDFLYRYFTEEEINSVLGPAGKIQLGEDSATSTMIERLEKMKEILGNKADVASGEWKIVRTRLGIVQSVSSLTRLFAKDVKFIPREGGVPTSFNGAKVKIQRLARERRPQTEEEAFEIVSEVINDVQIVSRTGQVSNSFGPLSLSYYQTAFTDYTEAYTNYLSYSRACEDIDKALSIAQSGVDLESTMRSKAGTDKRVFLIAVALVMVFELLLLLFMYFKRLVITAALIAIFPLVVMMYAMEKLMGISKTQTLSTWIVEFLTNVFIQSVHAFLYLLLVETGLKIYEADEDSWVIFLIAVVAMIMAENIVRSILGLKGKTVSTMKQSAGTIAKAAVATATIAGGLASIRKRYES